MSKRTIAKLREFQPITIGAFTLNATDMQVRGRPSFSQYLGIGDFIKASVQRSKWWLGAWLDYGEKREDWREQLSQASEATGLTDKTLQNVRSIYRAIEPSRRREDLEFSLHDAVVSLAPAEQSEWLQRAADEGWGLRELRLEIRASKRRRIIEGQAILEGQYRVIYADYPWDYGDRPPSGSGAQQHYPGLPVDEGCKLPIAAHATPDAVLFFWVTQPYLCYSSDGVAPDWFRLVKAWGFEAKTGQVWNKILPAGGNYVAVQHEHLLICTRGSCTPDHPVPMPPSVITERREAGAIHSSKPASFRQQIERMYDGPRLELFGRERHDGWTTFGNDAALWAGEARDQDERPVLDPVGSGDGGAGVCGAH